MALLLLLGGCRAAAAPRIRPHQCSSLTVPIASAPCLPRTLPRCGITLQVPAVPAAHPQPWLTHSTAPELLWGIKGDFWWWRWFLTLPPRDAGIPCDRMGEGWRVRVAAGGSVRSAALWGAEQPIGSAALCCRSARSAQCPPATEGLRPQGWWWCSLSAARCFSVGGLRVISSWLSSPCAPPALLFAHSLQAIFLEAAGLIFRCSNVRLGGGSSEQEDPMAADVGAGLRFGKDVGCVVWDVWDAEDVWGTVGPVG